ncbi:MAG: class I SAM-dependent methyltransferase [Candidatus Omnitrophica bacterium]|nr:class I SAM-dependent methyltransferase [Candidatus Omnitrophota bacterium]
MKTDKDWWKHFFDHTYLLTDARSVCDHSLTRTEVDLVEKILRLKKDDRILDLCGGYGRHSLELARRGYHPPTVVDFSNHMIKFGKKIASEAGLEIKFLRRDARDCKLRPNSFSAVLVMANSFGYFEDERDNRRILKEAYRLLDKGGKLLLDLTDPEYLRRNLKPVSWHEANDDVIVYRRRELRGDLIKAREIVISRSRGLIRDGLYCERLYDRGKIERILKDIGFRNLSIRRELKLHKRKKDYGMMTARVFTTAKKP